MITIKEIAEIVGVSTTTVSNVIHGKTKKVSEQNIQKIQKVLREKNYIAPMGLSMLTNRQSRMIGVVIHETKHYGDTLIADPFYSQVIGVIEKQLRESGYYMMLYSSDNLDDIFHMAVVWNVDGLICLSFTLNDYNKIRSLTQKPAVAIDIYNDNLGDYYNVGLQDEMGGYLMTKYLIESGYQKIFALALRDLGVDHDRYMGYRRALKEYGLPYKKEYFIALYDDSGKRQQNYERLCQFMKKDYAMFFFSDWYAIEAMTYFQRKGYQVPEDISIVGFDNMYFAEMCAPTLTTICQDAGEKACKAVEMLLKLLSGENVEEKIVLLPVRLILRESVKKRENNKVSER